MMEYLRHENIWTSKSIYEEAETKYYENLAKASVTPLAGEVAKARQLLIESRDSFNATLNDSLSIDPGAVKFFEKKTVEIEKALASVLKKLEELELRVSKIEQDQGNVEVHPHQEIRAIPVIPNVKKDDEDIDLFGSNSEDENDELDKIREERLAAYHEKKSKKPALIAKSNVIFDVKPWDDETNMAELEKEVRKITADGLLWGAAKLVPLAYGIHKLQISSVVEDDKISIDELQEQITAIEDHVQSVDIAAFNKI